MPRRVPESFIIYLIVNLINGKIYVGQTIVGLTGRWQGHLYEARYHKKGKYIAILLIDRAIAKYGEENFTISEICTASCQAELNFLEILFITALDTQNPKKGYNIQDGGAPGSHSEETKKKMSVIQTEIARRRGKERFVTNGVECIRIPVDSLIPVGYYPGRIYKLVKKVRKKVVRKPYTPSQKQLDSIRQSNKARAGNEKWITNGVIEQKLSINTTLPEGFHFGRLPFSEEHKNNSRKVSAGKKLTQDHKDKIRKSSRETDFHHSPETIEFLRQNRLRNPIAAMKGKHLSIVQRQNIKDSWILRKLRKLEKENKIMSHTVVVPHQIKSLDCLKKAVQQLAGLEFRELQTTFKTYEGKLKCDHAIGLKNNTSYEIGVLRKNADSYELKWDNFDSTLAAIVGHQCEHLVQGYAKQLVLQELPFGWEYTETRQSNGDLVMELAH